MIDPHELRIGNWVESYIVMISGSWYDKEGRQYGHNVITEPPIRHKQIDVEDLRIIINSKGLATYRAIPLTPEILEKCGFHKIDREPYAIHFKKHTVGNRGVVIRTSNCGNYYFDSYYGGIRKSIESLHQLQNIYFALTGKELNYSPNNKN